ncbi:MAG TPA: haloacid dehalogenase-like hydrolase [Trebonia sp.]|nr:haloacid dehalogenase-like hydrolase [Trebonia sp.]
MSRAPLARGRAGNEGDIHRLVLWNIDLTLVDVGRVSRAAFAEAFRSITGRPLVKLPMVAGLSEPEIFFEALASNGVSLRGDDSERLLAPFGSEYATAMARRRDALTAEGRLLPGAGEAMAAVAAVPGVVASVLTGSSRPNAVLKLRAFGLDRFVDLTVGGFGSEAYPKGTLLRVARQRAEEKYGASFAERATLYIADSSRDIAAARIGGATAVAVASGRAGTSELRDAGADHVLPDLTDSARLITIITS